MSVGPVVATVEHIIIAASFGATVSGHGLTTENILTGTDISSQMSRVGAVLECGCLVTRFQVLLGSVVRKWGHRSVKLNVVRSLTGPLPQPLLRQEH